MSTARTVRIGFIFLAYLAQIDNVLSNDIFTKPTPPTLAPNDATVSSPPTLTPSSPPLKIPAPGEDEDDILPTTIILEGHDSCSFGRDTYCFLGSQKNIDAVLGKNASDDELEDFLRGTMVDTIGVSYAPLVSGAVNHWTRNDSTKEAGWKGYSVNEPSQLYRVSAYAVGIMIKSLSNIDSIKGTFDATLKLYFFNVTEGPFEKIEDAANAIYNDHSKTTSKRVKSRDNPDHYDDYYRLNERSFPNAWAGGAGKTKNGEIVHPDGICSPEAMASMKPIGADDDFVKDLLRFPSSTVTRFWPNYVHDENGELSNVEVTTNFKFRPLNRHYYPFHRDLLDIDLEMGLTNMIHRDQPIVQNLLCLHPSYSGFASHVFGTDVGAGHSTSDALTMIPHLDFDRVEPFFVFNATPQFYYDEESQRAPYGNGSKVQRTLSLRIIVEHPRSKGFYEIFPLLFISLTAVANFISSNPNDMGATSMVQVLLGINTLVTQNTQWIGQNTNMASALWLAYAINGLWIFTVVLMTIINRAKHEEDDAKKSFIVYQNKIFRYLRLLAASLCLLYIPLAFISSDKDNGYQESETWIWALVVVFICLMFAIRAFKDYRKINKTEKMRAANEIKEFSDISKFHSKPLHLWKEDEVARWITIGSMHEASYFTDKKRSSIGEKLKAACVDGKLLCHYGKEFENLVEKLVQFVGLPFGDAMKLAEEVMSLLDVGVIPEVSSALVLAPTAESYGSP